VNGRWVRAEGLTKGVDDAYRGTVPAGSYPPVALCVEVDPRQVDVNVHPTKQLVRFSDEREARMAMCQAVNHAIEGTDAPVSDRDGRKEEPETPGTSSRSASEGSVAAGAALSAPEPHPTKDHPTSEEATSIPPAQRPVSNNGGGSTSSNRLFEAPDNPGRTASPQTPELPEQQKRTAQAPAPLSRAGSPAGVERGDLPRLRDLRVVGQIASGYILVDEPLAAWVVDQHVAHERALLDRLTAGPLRAGVPTGCDRLGLGLRFFAPRCG
jgi:DNA mismatch repair protein MutL